MTVIHSSDTRQSNPRQLAGSGELAIGAHQLCVRLGGRPVLSSVDLRVHAGQVVGLLGGNGAGKTTLLRCLAGLQRLASGSVEWFGQPSHRNLPGRSDVGYAAHTAMVYGELTPAENLLLAARLTGQPDRSERVSALLAWADLQACCDRPTSTLSQGMRQRLSIIRAIVHRPRIVLMDEPFTGLDQRSAEWLKELLKSLQATGAAVVLSLHDRQLAADTCHELWELERGRITAADPCGRLGKWVRPA